MKKLVTLSIVFISGLFSVNAQIMPVFSLKMSDYFSYDPSLTGQSGGSAVLSHKRQWVDLQGSPFQTVTYAGAHGLFYRDQLGLGGSVYMEENNIVQNIYSSISAAYHIKLNDKLNLSFGASGDFFLSQLNMDEVFVLDYDDQVLENYNNGTSFDFSGGVNLNNDFFKVGASFQRIRSLITDDYSNIAASGYYSFYAMGFIPMRLESDRLEPILIYRTQADGSSVLDATVFYEYDKLVMLGASYRTNNTLAFSLGLSLQNRIWLGYTFETLTGDLNGLVGDTHEITLRFNFNKQYFGDKKREASPKYSITPRKKKGKKEE